MRFHYSVLFYISTKPTKLVTVPTPRQHKGADLENHFRVSTLRVPRVFIRIAQYYNIVSFPCARKSNVEISHFSNSAFSPCSIYLYETRESVLFDRALL